MTCLESRDMEDGEDRKADKIDSFIESMRSSKGGEESMSMMANLLFSMAPNKVKQNICDQSVAHTFKKMKDIQNERYRYTVNSFKKLHELEYDLDKFDEYNKANADALADEDKYPSVA